MQIHTHTNTHANTHTYKYTHIQIHMQIHTYTPLGLSLKSSWLFSLPVLGHHNQGTYPGVYTAPAMQGLHSEVRLISEHPVVFPVDLP